MARLRIEYRRIGQLPTCIGNERIRITDDGRVSHSRNTTECEEGLQWSAAWHPVGQLDAAAMARLTRQIVDSGVLALAPQSIDPTAEGGRREEMDLEIDDQEHQVVAQNTDPPAFRTVVTLLWGVISALSTGASRG